MAQIGSFGDIIFEVSRPRSLSLEGGYRHEAGARLNVTDVIGAEPLVEYVGPESESISFQLKLLESLGVDPQAEYDRLKAMCDAGTAAAFVINGKPVGSSGTRWIIENLSADHKALHPASGRSIWIDVSVSLRKYVTRY